MITRTIIITGAARGIGQATARAAEIAAKGATTLVIPCDVGHVAGRL